MPVELLREGLSDPSAPVRRLAAISLGIAGDAAAVASPVAELARDPSVEVIEAPTMIGDEDVIVLLGRCAENHPALAGTVFGALCEMDSSRALSLVRHLETGSSASGRRSIRLTVGLEAITANAAGLRSPCRAQACRVARNDGWGR